MQRILFYEFYLILFCTQYWNKLVCRYYELHTLKFINWWWIRPTIAYVTFCRWSGVLLMSLLIAVPPEVQINTPKIVKGVLYWTTTQQQLLITTTDEVYNQMSHLLSIRNVFVSAIFRLITNCTRDIGTCQAWRVLLTWEHELHTQ